MGLQSITFEILYTGKGLIVLNYCVSALNVLQPSLKTYIEQAPSPLQKLLITANNTIMI